MRILIDICHPAHVHFFRNPIQLLQKQGDEILVTSRGKECALALLDHLGVEHRCLSEQHDGGYSGMVKELLARNRALIKEIRSFEPDVMAAVGGIFIAQSGLLTRVPSVVFYDTERARLQNMLTYPFASRVVVPHCYKGSVPRRRTVRYRGCHELSYLHPDYFTPDYDLALANGLAPQGDTFLLRLVSWKANHDVGEQGWSLPELDRVVENLTARGTVIISAETTLPGHLERFRYRGNPGAMHHVMAYCRAFVGESATMASECAVLGVPSLYVASPGQYRGYIDWMAGESGLVRHEHDYARIMGRLNEMLRMDATHWRARRDDLISACQDVPLFISDTIRTKGSVCRGR